MYSLQYRPINPKFDVTEHEDGLVILTPKSGKINQTMVFLHGWGQSGQQWIDYFIEGEATPEDTKIVLPTAPVRFTTFYNKAGNAWCDFYTLKFSQEDTNLMENFEHVKESVARISKILDKEVEEIGDSKKCFMGGFSSGGFIAAMTWKGFRKPLAGLILHSGKAGKIIPVAPEQEFSPIFWTHGVDDVLFKYRHGVWNNSNLDTGKRKFIHFTRGGLGHAVDRVIQLKARRFIEDVMLSKPQPKL